MSRGPDIRRFIVRRFRLVLLLALLAVGHGLVTRTVCLFADGIAGASNAAVAQEAPCAAGEAGCHGDCGMIAVPASDIDARLAPAHPPGRISAGDADRLVRATDPDFRPPIV